MAANKFATMVHRNTNKITLILVYAVLEWALILLLLLNSLFSYLIIKFSQLCALKPPCLWCSTLHRFLEPQSINSHRDLLCELHSKEVSILGFCPNHKKLAEIKDLCEDCFSSHLDFQSEVKQSNGEDEEEEEEENLKCSCCGLEFHKKSVDDFVLTQKSWDVLEYTKSGGLLMGNDGNLGSNVQVEENLEIRSGKENHMNCDGKDLWDSNTFEIETDLNQFERKEDKTSDFPPQDLEFFFDFSGNQLVPIELVDSTTEESQNVSEADEDHEFRDYQKAHVIQNNQKPGLEVESTELKEPVNSLVFHAKNSEFIDEKSAIVQESRPLFIEELQENAVGTDKFDPNDHLVHEVTEIPVLDSCVEEPLTNLHDLHLKTEKGLESKKSSGNCNETEENKISDTPTSIESLNQLTKNMLLIDPKESRAEESFDTMEKLKSALEAERKALHALYAELEEERGASAVAASETMAMINRLQEEKAAMQMEALQYQRMMEEQSEYDQEALQLLNDLMIKREKELEMYRKKVADYEAKVRRFSLGSAKSATGSGSCSHSEDTDGFPIDGNQESWNPELESSLADFEVERVSIFEQIKVLEEKLFALSDEEDQQHFVDIKNPIEDLEDENGFHSNELEKEKGIVPLSDSTNSTRMENGVHSGELEKEKIIVPLSDTYGTENGFFHSGNIGKKRIDFEEEVDQVYGRLQALEADREFLKHCIGSLKKGDKGMELLQEILQHLRDLRTMDLQ